MFKFASDFAEVVSECELFVEDDTQVFNFVMPGDIVSEELERLKLVLEAPFFEYYGSGFGGVYRNSPQFQPLLELD
ncbi:hypothetical protein TNIN_265621 [Trichonephila inaurata madagascariensis]|uniref:Uncharacterized protein n=1 Tax=Trichonephila inaurata madagascariensis TaxID=2747483 RepID=A0A8X7CRP0_9ARAC|nr:hypothetical protein TNIN_260751 [Trichonephila inaurata madagascariensis]GFY75920.1 hypothetical protein TNIN_265621 [Trichonephila inaurata madagascariensis]